MTNGLVGEVGREVSMALMPEAMMDDVRLRGLSGLLGDTLVAVAPAQYHTMGSHAIRDIAFHLD
jgi:hypothetical protein